ncbi:hypothetical protein LguiA_021090 [Lonicera macranthoides]
MDKLAMKPGSQPNRYFPKIRRRQRSAKVLSNDQNFAMGLLRTLFWPTWSHSAGTFDVSTTTGGLYGTISLAGVVQITGRPDVPFHYGREDKVELPSEGRMPDTTQGVKKELKKIVKNRKIKACEDT